MSIRFFLECFILSLVSGVKTVSFKNILRFLMLLMSLTMSISLSIKSVPFLYNFLIRSTSSPRQKQVQIHLNALLKKFVALYQKLILICLFLSISLLSFFEPIFFYSRFWACLWFLDFSLFFYGNRDAEEVLAMKSLEIALVRKACEAIGPRRMLDML